MDRSSQSRKITDGIRRTMEVVSATKVRARPGLASRSA